MYDSEPGADHVARLIEWHTPDLRSTSAHADDARLVEDIDAALGPFPAASSVAG